MSAELAENLRAVERRIAAAAARAGRAPGEIALVGVAKQVDAARVADAVAAGLAHVGENYVNEAREKLPVVSAALDRRGVAWPRWHFVGRLQRNKARPVALAFDCVQSLDRPELGDALERHAAEAGRTLEALVQVNLADEPQKGGLAPEAVPALLAHAARWRSVRVVGLMTVPPAGVDPRPHFAALRALRDRLRREPGGESVGELSMGMSADFEVAIEEGATIIRVGTAIFGARPVRADAAGGA
jgi:pyridoxal phosphate enzyme (YggS family)